MPKDTLLNVSRWMKDKSIHFFIAKYIHFGFSNQCYIVISPEFFIELKADPNRIRYGTLKFQQYLLKIEKVLYKKIDPHKITIVFKDFEKPKQKNKFLKFLSSSKESESESIEQKEPKIILIERTYTIKDPKKFLQLLSKNMKKIKKIKQKLN
ncbi:hypothetical protein M0811_01681 [Anaeramoeba ignava]|uniref:Uncharacterized protein n=1 Tax=Anaeramoeba ignava TaxID=1746090 RepID=A0A9Q0LCN9_ANAIG|nr:hypothetical protein M0811_01681 [Anaeramoeba ignava]